MTLTQLLAGLAVAMALEGLLYAAFPGAMQRAVTRLAALPPDRLRWTGLAAAIAGIAVASLLAR
ncbi:DUF2065 family protein [Pseudoroseomonas cervicalis]|uniref:DUF2065 domain-containing protein n=1 Tax=Pseudoroseomonas cervicalis ATCC 49957 TaxID=525371 RepID=D5RIT7_9PROT|nr:DUF2065 domain-containing protein [Pseudoroseomonas cervicalis]EFH12759.1 hypothetical protein HMPREF0731_0997 [Pseudoroseomonas cervicalis ATCC 49957]